MKRAVVVLLLLFSACAAAQPGERWRFTHAMSMTGPWPVPAPDRSGLQGRGLEFAPGDLRGADPFACAPARVELLDKVPSEGLFEGTLPAPADEAARKLGLGAPPYTVRRVTCPNAGFDFVRADGDTLLVVLDERIWTLSRAPGTRAAAGSPEATVQALLESHFAGDRGFAPASLAPKTQWLSASMNAAIKTYFARPRPKDEVPPIDGDAFTDSQEGPTRFAVGAATVSKDHAELEVRFADGWVEKRLKYRLVRERAGWRVDDVRGEAPDDRGLRQILEND
ncbi:MAG: hypothetical protein K0Q76_2600 [Panacagrimonas sp.]|jgi:hypothetical protein|nr:hypothetical protein [Panacagrimonas sp.]MCC2657492.1 hypothetical protein [Panacagrimonas sp.]